MNYIRIGRLELFVSKPFNVDYRKASCGCHIFTLGFCGFTILSKGCSSDS